MRCLLLRGDNQIRTGGEGVADLCLTTWLCRPIWKIFYIITPKKQLRQLKNKLLVDTYVINEKPGVLSTVKKCAILDEIYVNKSRITGGGRNEWKAGTDPETETG